MKRRLASVMFAGLVSGLAPMGSASACYVELSWTADPVVNTAVLTADFAATDPVTAESYTALGNTGNLLKLQLSIRDKQSQAELADIDLLAILQNNQQTLQLLSDLSKQLADMQMSIARKMAGATAFDSADATLGDTGFSLSITSSLPGFETIVVPLACQGACEGEYASTWAFDHYAPEPAGLPLVSTALALAGLAALRGRRVRSAADLRSAQL